MTDIDRSRVLEVVPGRDTDAAKSCWECLGELADKVQAVAMDMWDAYAAAAREKAKNAAIVHDRFHVSKHLNEAVDRVRKKEHAQLRKEGKDWLGGYEVCFPAQSGYMDSDTRAGI